MVLHVRLSWRIPLDEIVDSCGATREVILENTFVNSCGAIPMSLVFCFNLYIIVPVLVSVRNLTVNKVTCFSYLIKLSINKNEGFGFDKSSQVIFDKIHALCEAPV